ncbi:MAG: SprT family zinc-dependent metalloprotease [Marivibrio sp.]|uniref:M48 family metallopeptidase n=1 Tax=Marivibrio sp. TaxID=2039719 RepID=UPI0032ECC5C1
MRLIDLAGREIPVILRRHDRARRISLRIDGRRDAAVLTLPPRAAEREAVAFLMQHRDWVLAQLDALPPRIAFADGAVVPLLGRERRIRHDPTSRGRGGVFLDGPDERELVVAGESAHLPRRVTDFMKREARAAIKPLARDKAAALGVRMGRIVLRDQRSRWGSCTASGDLNFSWRLIYCPPEILDYVVAHEVAHLRHMDHSPAFWATVAEIAPSPKQSRAWLREHGARLHRIG